MAVADKRPAERNFLYEQQLTNAISSHRRVRLRYHLDFHYRIFEPYILYQDEKGRFVVGGTRVVDEKRPKVKPEPRKYEIGLITDLQVLDETFDVDPRFRSSRDKFTKLNVLCAIDR